MDPDQTAPKEQSDLGPRCLENGFYNHKQTTKQTTIVVTGALRDKVLQTNKVIF